MHRFYTEHTEHNRLMAGLLKGREVSYPFIPCFRGNIRGKLSQSYQAEPGGSLAYHTQILVVPIIFDLSWEVTIPNLIH